YLYTSNGKISGGGSANSVSNFLINSLAGSLTSIVTAPAGPYAVGNNTRPMSVTVDPTGRFVYTGNYGAAKVSGFSLNSANGTLTPVTGATFAVSTNPTQLLIVEE
ncbi:MAG: beta-propeller fold lactonase family protein, partial [Bdellovibrionia bacterium]